MARRVGAGKASTRRDGNRSDVARKGWKTRRRDEARYLTEQVEGERQERLANNARWRTWIQRMAAADVTVFEQPRRLYARDFDAVQLWAVLGNYVKDRERSQYTIAEEKAAVAQFLSSQAGFYSSWYRPDHQKWSPGTEIGRLNHPHWWKSNTWVLSPQKVLKEVRKTREFHPIAVRLESDPEFAGEHARYLARRREQTASVLAGRKARTAAAAMRMNAPSGKSKRDPVNKGKKGKTRR